ncbi:MAG TPA: hypothetical protein VLB82_00470, partial [Thermodesulfobacteriota bacterium]|nr:hypothetical protein [Thermodesulfobacteriota bacterium]
ATNPLLHELLYQIINPKTMSKHVLQLNDKISANSNSKGGPEFWGLTEKVYTSYPFASKISFARCLISSWSSKMNTLAIL